MGVGGVKPESMEQSAELLGTLIEMGALLIHRGKPRDGSLGLEED